MLCFGPGCSPVGHHRHGGTPFGDALGGPRGVPGGPWGGPGCSPVGRHHRHGGTPFALGGPWGSRGGPWELPEAPGARSGPAFKFFCRRGNFWEILELFSLTPGEGGGPAGTKKSTKIGPGTKKARPETSREPIFDRLLL